MAADPPPREWTPAQTRALALALEGLERRRALDLDRWLVATTSLAWRQIRWRDEAGVDATAKRMLSAIDEAGPENRMMRLASVVGVLHGAGHDAWALELIDIIDDPETRDDLLKHALAAAAKRGDREQAAEVLQRFAGPVEGASDFVALAASGDVGKLWSAFQKLAGDNAQPVVDALKAGDREQATAAIQLLIGSAREDAISFAARRAVDGGQYEIAEWLWGQSTMGKADGLAERWSADDAIAYGAATAGNAAIVAERLPRVDGSDQRASILCELARKQSDYSDHEPALANARAARDLLATMDESARSRRAPAIAEELARAGAAEEALALLPLVTEERGRLIARIAREQARHGAFAGAMATSRLIPPDEFYAERCRRDIIAARVGAGDAPPSVLSQISDVNDRAGAALDATSAALTRGDTSLMQELTTLARISVLIGNENDRVQGLVNVARAEIELGLLRGAAQTIAKIPNANVRTEYLAELAEALALAGDRDAAQQTFAKAWDALAKKTGGDLCTLVLERMVRAGFLNEALQKLREHPNAWRLRMRQRIAIACMRDDSTIEQGFKIASQIKGARERVQTYLDMAEPPPVRGGEY